MEAAYITEMDFRWHVPLPYNAASRPRCLNRAELHVRMTGRGAVEVGLSINLESFATTLGSREQLLLSDAAF